MRFLKNAGPLGKIDIYFYGGFSFGILSSADDREVDEMKDQTIEITAAYAIW